MDDQMTDAAVADRLARIETKIDGLTDTMRGNQEHVNAVLSDHSQRLSAVEIAMPSQDSREDVADHEKRLKVVERICYGFLALGGVGIFGAGGAAVGTVVK